MSLYIAVHSKSNIINLIPTYHSFYSKIIAFNIAVIAGFILRFYNTVLCTNNKALHINKHVLCNDNKALRTGNDVLCTVIKALRIHNKVSLANNDALHISNEVLRNRRITLWYPSMHLRVTSINIILNNSIFFLNN